MGIAFWGRDKFPNDNHPNLVSCQILRVGNLSPTDCSVTLPCCDSSYLGWIENGGYPLSYSPNDEAIIMLNSKSPVEVLELFP
jgi:hypothetical protein